MAQCRQVYRYICTNLDRRVDSPECRAIRKHLRGCPECTEYLRSVKKTIALFRSLPTPPISHRAHEKLFRTIDRAWKRGGKFATTHSRRSSRTP